MNKLTTLIPFVAFIGLARWFAAALPPMSPHTSSVEVFACPGAISVVLGDSCRDTLELTEVLFGQFSACVQPSDFGIVVYDNNPGNGAIIDGAGTFRYVVFLQNSAACTDFIQCEGKVTAADRRAPRIIPPSDRVLPLYCDAVRLLVNQPSSISLTDTALVTDNCSFRTEPLTTFHDRIVYDNQCDTLIIQRFFHASDFFGNTADTFQTITAVRPALSDIHPAGAFDLDTSCAWKIPYSKDVKGNIAPSVSGYPFLIGPSGDTVWLTPGGACGFSADYTDRRDSVCTNQVRIARTWRIIDWCRRTERLDTQIIRIGDLAPPVVELIPGKESLRISTGPFNCQGVLEIPAPQIQDACSSTQWSAEIWQDSFPPTSNPFGILPPGTDSLLITVSSFGATSRIVSGLPLGGFRVWYRVEDACHNETRISARLVVEDGISPIAICRSGLIVSLNSVGTATIRIGDVNGGSKDNCQLASLSIRRKISTTAAACASQLPGFSPWDSTVLFSCCDIGQPVEVELRATDAAGNTNTSWTTVRIHDKIAPSCTPPSDTTIDCLHLPEGFNPQDSSSLARIFGIPSVFDNCAAAFEELTPLVVLDDCETGTITRRFQAVDRAGNRSTGIRTQTITIAPARSYAVRFPKDFEDYCGDALPDSVAMQEHGCNVLAVQVSDKRYESGGEECYKVLRTYEIINWCEYDGHSAPVVIPRDADCNGVAGDRDVWVVVQPNGQVFLDANDQPSDHLPAAGVKGMACDGSTNPVGYWTSSSQSPALQSTGYWKYTQVIKYFDNIPPKIYTEKEVTVCSNQFDCSAEIYLSVGVGEVCSKDVEVETKVLEEITEYYTAEELTWERYGRFPKYLIAGLVPVGTYLIEITVRDGCGNQSATQVRVNVVDCGAPVPICHNGLTTELNPVPPGEDLDADGFPDPAAALVRVGDLLQSALEDCSFPVRYSINRVGEVADSTRQSLLLTCKDIGYLPVEVRAWDAAHNPWAEQPNGSKGGPNSGYCTTYVHVSDTRTTCDTIPKGFPLEGAVYNAFRAPLPSARIELRGDGISATVSDSLGTYRFPLLQEKKSYTLRPYKNEEDPRSGVTTFDLLMMTQHILGTRTLTDPYQLLAADVNLSGSLTTQDMILLRKLILSASDRFPHGKVYRFVDASFTFPDPANPWKTAVPDSKVVANMEAEMHTVDFIAIKLGDINGSSPVFGPRGFFLYRSAIPVPPVSVQAPDRFVEEGALLSVPFTIQSDIPVAGFQFELALNPDLLAFESLHSDLLMQEHQLVITEKGDTRLRFSWNGRPIPAGESGLFTLQVRVRKSGLLSEALQIPSRDFLPEAYHIPPDAASSPLVHPLELTLKQALPIPMDLSVAPNPAQDEVLVQWNTPEAGEALIQVRDPWGRIIRTHRQVCDPGVHQWQMERSAGPAGMYLISLQLANKTISKKVLFLP